MDLPISIRLTLLDTAIANVVAEFNAARDDLDKLRPADPYGTVSAKEQHWLELGRALRAVSPALFRAYLNMLEETVRVLGGDPGRAPDGRTKPERDKREALTVTEPDLSILAEQIVKEPNRLCASCQHPARNHTLGRCRKKWCGCGGWRG